MFAAILAAVVLIAMPAAAHAASSRLRVQAVAGESAVLCVWNALPGHDVRSYRVERAPNARGPWRTIGTTTARRFVDTAPLAGGAYYRIRVNSRDRTGAALSAPVRPSPLGSPVMSDAVAGETKSVCVWSGPPMSLVSGYVVERASSPDGTWLAVGSPASSRWDDTSAFGESYWYRVRAVAGGVVTGTPSAAMVALPVPVPGALAAVAGEGVTRCTWTPEPGAVSYRIERASAFTGPWVTVGTTSAAVLEDRSPLVGPSYYRVRAVSAVGAEGAAGPPVAGIAVRAPSGLSAVAGDAEAGCMWSPEPGLAVTYRVERASAASGPYVLAGETTSTVFRESLEARGAVFYRVRAVFAGVAGPASAAVAPSAVAVPEGLVVRAGDMRNLVSWSDAGVAGYVVERATSADGPWSSLATCTGPGLDDTVAEARDWYYRVRGVGPLGITGRSSAPVLNAAILMSADVPPSGATMRAANGRMVLTFPSRAFAAVTEVRVTERGDAAAADLIPTTPQYEFRASASLLASAEVVVRYSVPPERFAVAGVVEHGCDWMSLDETTGAWVPVPTTIDTTASTLSAAMPHFSEWRGAMQPHGTSLTQVQSNSCNGVCHTISTVNGRQVVSSSKDATVCYACHAGAAPTDAHGVGVDGPNIEAEFMQYGGAYAFQPATQSRHPLAAPGTATAVTLNCVSCHDPHKDPADAPQLLRALDAVTGLPVASKGGVAAGNAFCWACHGTKANSRVNIGVPGYYTRSGGDKRTGYVTSAHAGKDCVECHTGHGSTSRRLLASPQPAVCTGCHTAIAPFVSSAGSGLSVTSGHRVKSAGASLTVETGLPCRDCHDPHGSTRGNAHMLSDALGGSLDTSSAAGVRRFCLSCHTTPDGYGWDSTSTAYAPVPASARVEGLARLGGAEGTGPTGGKNWLLLASLSGHQRTDTQSCYECHGADYSKPDAYNVHAPALYVPSAHTSDVSTGTATIGTATYTVTCTDCHSRELGPDHGGQCETCHPQPAEGLSPAWRKSCVEGGCHTLASAAPIHATIDAAHALPGTLPACFDAGCHDAPSDLAGLHSFATTSTAEGTRTGCGVCHTPDSVPSSGACGSCHDVTNPHPPLDEAHASTQTTEDLVFVTGHYGGVQIVSTGCSMCHSMDLITQHGRDCTMCHASANADVRAAIRGHVTLCSGCHLAKHAKMVTGHKAAASASPCQSAKCHAGGYIAGNDAPVDAAPGWCGNCHGLYPDLMPPTTTATVAPAYVGDARIVLVSTDGVPGVKRQYYRIDGGATQTVVIEPAAPTAVCTLTVPAPVSGSQAHTLQFWAEDWMGNVEVPKPAAAFVVSRDTTPPVTTSDAKASYLGNAIIHLTPSDDSSTGVMATFYRLDGAPSVLGTTVIVPQPSSGSAAHNLEFWSVDWAGNVETTQVAGFTQARDGAPPTTSVSWSDWSYQLRATLTATDVAGTGVAATYASLDGGAFAKVPTRVYFSTTEGMHTIQFYSVDNAGNVEATQTSTFLRDWTPPVTLTDALPSYAGTAVVHFDASDAVSGVKYTYYKLDAAGYVSGKVATIVPPASGSAAHTIQYYSVDNCNRSETVKSVSFTVFKSDTTPPVTSADATSSYVGPATIALSATDTGGTGVRSTAYRLDGGAVTTATVVNVPAPLAGSVAHTLEFWSVDWAGNRETTRAASFSVSNELSPPVTTSDAVASYGYAATINLSVTDTGGSGVQGTYYRLDGAAPATGTAVHVLGPTTGQTRHTLQFWSVDNAGNVETTNTATFWIVSDTTPPVSETDVVESYVLTATLDFWCWDDAGGAGLDGIYYTLDGSEPVHGSWGPGWAEVVIPPPASGDAQHVVTWWAVDNAGNAEAARTVTLTVSADHFPPSSTCYDDGRWYATRLANAWTLYADDISGVAGTYYSFDGAAWRTATIDRNGNWTTRGYSGLSEGDHELLFYSVDTLGNREETKTATIHLDGTPPASTSDIGGSYEGTAVLTFTGQDFGSGMDMIHVWVDGVSSYPLNYTWGAVFPSTLVQTWEVPPPASGTVTHKVEFLSNDDVGNYEATNTVYFTQTAPTDRTPPSGTMVLIGGAAYSTTAAVWVDSSVTDTGTGGVWQMRVGSGYYWMPYSPHYEWRIGAIQGSTTIQMQYRDRAGNVLTLPGTIRLDLAAPTGTMVLAGGVPVTSDMSITVTSAMSDWVSGVPDMRIDPGTGTYGEWMPYAASTSIELPAGDGLKTVNVQYRDGAGLVATKTATILLDTSGTTLPAFAGMYRAPEAVTP